MGAYQPQEVPAAHGATPVDRTGRVAPSAHGRHRLPPPASADTLRRQVHPIERVRLDSASAVGLDAREGEIARRGRRSFHPVASPLRTEYSTEDADADAAEADSDMCVDMEPIDALTDSAAAEGVRAVGAFGDEQHLRGADVNTMNLGSPWQGPIWRDAGLEFRAALMAHSHLHAPSRLAASCKKSTWRAPRPPSMTSSDLHHSCLGPSLLGQPHPLSSHHINGTVHPPAGACMRPPKRSLPR